MVTASGNESELLRRVREGSRDAAGEVFSLHWPAAWKIAYAVCRDHALAEDVAQDALIRALATVKRFDGSRPFAAYVHRIVVNGALNALRAQKPACPLGEAHALATDDVVHLPDRRLASAVAGLSLDQRAVVALRFGADLTVAEIAAALGLPDGTVSSRLARALAELRRTLGVEDVA
jgi:RNA polymerase sigma-70 factor, ECF subfamily